MSLQCPMATEICPHEKLNLTTRFQIGANVVTKAVQQYLSLHYILQHNYKKKCHFYPTFISNLHSNGT